MVIIIIFQVTKKCPKKFSQNQYLQQQKTSFFGLNTTNVSLSSQIYVLLHGLVYMDIGTGCEKTGKIDFGFAAASATSRQWEVKVTQIECTSRSRYYI